MKSILRIAALPALVLALGAQTAPSPQLPDRPAAAFSKYKDNWAPVIGAEAREPIVTVNGSPVVLESSAAIVLSVGDHYGKGFVAVTDAHSTDVPMTNDAEAAATMASSVRATAVTFEANLVPDTDIAGAYALLVCSPPHQKPDDPPSLAIVASQIGDLKAGKQMHLSLVLPKLSDDEGPGWNALVFSAGREVRSTGMGGVLPAYFDRIETLALKKRIAERVATGADAPVSVFRQMPLGLPDAIMAKYRGTIIKAEVNVNADGRVVSAAPVVNVDSELNEAVGRGFTFWLFLPPVKNGAAAPASVIIPLKM
jgi:hypothetical protein